MGKGLRKQLLVGTLSVVVGVVGFLASFSGFGPCRPSTRLGGLLLVAGPIAVLAGRGIALSAVVQAIFRPS